MGQLYSDLPHVPAEHSINGMAALMCCLPGEPEQEQGEPYKQLGAGLASPFPSQHNGPGEVGDTNGGGRSHQAHPGSRFYFISDDPAVDEISGAARLQREVSGRTRQLPIVELSSFP